MDVVMSIRLLFLHSWLCQWGGENWWALTLVYHPIQAPSVTCFITIILSYIWVKNWLWIPRVDSFKYDLHWVKNKWGWKLEKIIIDLVMTMTIERRRKQNPSGRKIRNVVEDVGAEFHRMRSKIWCEIGLENGRWRSVGEGSVEN